MDLWGNVGRAHLTATSQTAVYVTSIFPTANVTFVVSTIRGITLLETPCMFVKYQLCV